MTKAATLKSPGTAAVLPAMGGKVCSATGTVIPTHSFQTGSALTPPHSGTGKPDTGPQPGLKLYAMLL